MSSKERITIHYCNARNLCLRISGSEAFNKVCIDDKGCYKNCPSMESSFGNVYENNLSDLLENKDFKRYWGVTKDKIDICKNCEFRYVCNDCRVFIENPDDIYSKPLKCGYNPYNGKWEDWNVDPS